MVLGQRLRARRERMALTQAQAARALGIPRELVSMWETGARGPNRGQLEQLARLYQVDVDYLVAEEDTARQYEREVLTRELPQDPEERREIDCWLDFLDAWAQFQDEFGGELPGPQKPPRGLGVDQVITDARRAPTLAVKVREHYRLGLDAIPDLLAFLDKQGMLVYRAPLGAIGDGGERISGAFYNHPQLGYCILVNADTTPGRQAFTLAHEFCHALFHYPLGGLISRKGDRDAKEAFADAFAAHFLVPGRELRRLGEDERAKQGLDPYKALRFAAYYRVSYATLLARLREEGLISPALHREWKAYSPSAMARTIGLNAGDFRLPQHQPLSLERYPVSVLGRVKWAVDTKRLPPAEAARLLNVDGETLERSIALLVEPPAATEAEAQEFEELPF